MVLPQKCSLFSDEATLALPWNGLCVQNLTLHPAVQTEFHCPFPLRRAVKQHTNIQIKENKLNFCHQSIFRVSHSKTQRWHKTSLKTQFVVLTDFPLCMPSCRRLYVVIGNIWGTDYSLRAYPVTTGWLSSWQANNLDSFKANKHQKMNPLWAAAQTLVAQITNNLSKNASHWSRVVLDTYQFSLFLLYNSLFRRNHIQSFVTFYQDYTKPLINTMSGTFSIDLSLHGAVRYTFPHSPQRPHLEEAGSNGGWSLFLL